MAGAWAYLSAMQGDEVQKRVAEVAKALYRRTDELAVLLARAITRRLWSSPLMLGCRRRGAAPDRVHAEQHQRVFRVDGRVPTMSCTAVAVQQTVDRTTPWGLQPADLTSASWYKECLPSGVAQQAAREP